MSDLREDIQAAFDQASGREPEIIESPIDDPIPEVIDKPMDETGKFAKKEETPVVETQEVIDPNKPVEPKHRAPEALKAVMKAKWAELPEEWREEVARLELAGKNGVSHLMADAQLGKELMAEIKPYEQLIQAEGGTPTRAVRNLLQTAAILRTGTPQQKQQVLMGLIQTYQIPVARSQPANGQTPQQDVAALLNPILQPLVTRTQQMEQYINGQRQEAQQRDESTRSSAVESFLSETDATGQPKHPMDDKLGVEFADEIRLVKTQNPKMSHSDVLKVAYERVSWKVPEMREILLKRQSAGLRQQADLRAKKNGSVSVRNSAPAASGINADSLSLRDTIRAAMHGGKL